MANDNYPFNQFANMGDYETITYGRQTNDNAEYLYPGNLIPNIYDSPADKTRTDTVVQRGFIRGIMPQVINDNPVSSKSKTMSFLKQASVPVRRCFFQFNPSLILRSVTASSSTLNPLLQDPSQLIQPIPGQSSFEFQLLFNREREVSNQKFAPPGRTKLQNTSRNPVNVEAGTVSQEDVGSIGVLADLHVLDSIIGQSITQDLVNMVQAYWAVSSSLTNQANKGEKDFTPIDLQQFGQEDFKKKLASVYGNTAFLNPMPVRIVFSSLFMVEGFVTASNVAFHKFTKNMVPTVCTVTLSVQALYIGFARKNAYLSDQLAQQFEEIDKKNIESVQNVVVGNKLLDDHLHIKLSGFALGGYANGAQPNPAVSLNTWVKNIWDLYESNEYFSFGSFGGTAPKFEGLQLWGDPELKGALGLKIFDITLSRLTLFLLRTDKLPPEMRGSSLLSYASKHVSLVAGGTRGINPEWLIGSLTISTSGGNGVPDNKIDIDFNKVLESKYTESNPYGKQWVSTPIRSITGDPGNTYFGTNKLTLLVSCDFKASVPDATTDKPQPVKSTKVAYIELNPNSAASWEDFVENKFIKPTTPPK